MNATTRELSRLVRDNPAAASKQICRALNGQAGNVVQTALHLEVALRTLHHWIVLLGIDVPAIKLRHGTPARGVRGGGPGRPLGSLDRWPRAVRRPRKAA